MRTALIKVHNKEAGILTEINSSNYEVTYFDAYSGAPISLTMPINQKKYSFDRFPPFFDGVLPEGVQLKGLLRVCKIDAKDYFSQLVKVGEDLVGAVTVHKMP